MDFFSNPWVIGIGGGSLSGFFVLYVQKAIFSNKDSKEYAQKLSQANHEVLYAVRPGISEDIIPDNNILKHLISATAKKYGVDSSDMNDLNAISSDLIKEVMDSSFISSSSKKNYCDKLNNINEDDLKNDSVEKTDYEREFDISSRYSNQMAQMLSLTAGIFTALVATQLIDFSKIATLDNFLYMAMPALLAISISFFYMLIRKRRERIYRFRKYLDDTNQMKNDEILESIIEDEFNNSKYE